MQDTPKNRVPTSSLFDYCLIRKYRSNPQHFSKMEFNVEFNKFNFKKFYIVWKVALTQNKKPVQEILSGRQHASAMATKILKERMPDQSGNLLTSRLTLRSNKSKFYSYYSLAKCQNLHLTIKYKSILITVDQKAYVSNVRTFQQSSVKKGGGIGSRPQQWKHYREI